MNEHGFDALGHLPDELVTAWLDGELDGEERARVAAHLADCDLCREEIVAVRRALAEVAAPEPVARAPRRLRYLVTAAAAAAAVWFLVVPSVREPDPRLRDGASAEAGIMPAVEVVAPLGDGVRRGDVTFTWRGAGRDAQYTLTLTDAAGALVWRISTPDTALVLPDDVRLEADATHYWTVDALLPDGETATSGPKGFATVP